MIILPSVHLVSAGLIQVRTRGGGFLGTLRGAAWATGQRYIFATREGRLLEFECLAARVPIDPWPRPMHEAPILRPIASCPCTRDDLLKIPTGCDQPPRSW